MLSRFANIRSQGTTKCLMPIFQRITTVHTSAPLNEEDLSKKEFPPATSKRDFVNYPRLLKKAERPPVRLGVIPESWFNFFYPKTGYTGPYAFIITVGTYLLSKEKLVIEEALMQTLSFVVLFYVLIKKFREPCQNFINKLQKEESQNYDDFQNKEKTQILNDLKILESNEAVKKAIEEATIAKKEFVLMQMEIAYRERMAEMFKKIKSRLDCMVELENAERRNAHKNLVDYVLLNVHKSITPELEKNVLQNCISELNALATKA